MRLRNYKSIKYALKALPYVRTQQLPHLHLCAKPHVCETRSWLLGYLGEIYITTFISWCEFSESVAESQLAGKRKE